MVVDPTSAASETVASDFVPIGVCALGTLPVLEVLRGTHSSLFLHLCSHRSGRQHRCCLTKDQVMKMNEGCCLVENRMVPAHCYLKLLVAFGVGPSAAAAEEVAAVLAQ